MKAVSSLWVCGLISLSAHALGQGTVQFSVSATDSSIVTFASGTFTLDFVKGTGGILEFRSTPKPEESLPAQANQFKKFALETSLPANPSFSLNMPPDILTPILEPPVQRPDGTWISGGGGSVNSEQSTPGRITAQPGSKKPTAGAIASVSQNAEAITRVARQDDGSFEIKGNGNAGFRYAIECSNDLQNWKPVGYAANEAGALSFKDRRGCVEGQRFYRLKAQE